MFNDSIKFLGRVAENRGKILFVGTKFAAREIIKEEANRCGMPYVNYRWLGGMLTNYKTIRQSIRRLKDLEEKVENVDYLAKITKKERLNLMREKEKLTVVLEGIKNMGGLPDAIFIIDVGNENIAVAEAKRLKIPVVGVVDTNCSPENIDYIIPGNDDALRSIRLYAKTIADVIIEKRGLPELAEKEIVEEDVIPVVTKKVAKKPVAEVAEGASTAEGTEKPAVKKKTVTKTTVAKKPAVKKAAAAKKPVAKKKTTTKKEAEDK